MQKGERTLFSRRKLYDQKDQATNEYGPFELCTSVWAAAWSYEGASHPVTSRIRLNIVHGLETPKFDLMTAEIELWREHEWKLMDVHYDKSYKHNNIEDVEQECMFMTESFLMGVPISDVREKYGVNKEVDQRDESEDQEREEQENVLKLFPKKD